MSYFSQSDPLQFDGLVGPLIDDKIKKILTKRIESSYYFHDLCLFVFLFDVCLYPL